MLRLRALAVMGHSCPRIGQALGAPPGLVARVQSGEAATVSAALAEAVAWLYDQWWDRSAPSLTPGQRSAAGRARQRAERADWCAGAALDDELIDEPAYLPAVGYRPAAGTGTAAEVRWRPGEMRHSERAATHWTGEGQAS
jgi:hypothetical protein